MNAPMRNEIMMLSRFSLIALPGHLNLSTLIFVASLVLLCLTYSIMMILAAKRPSIMFTTGNPDQRPVMPKVNLSLESTGSVPTQERITANPTPTKPFTSEDPERPITIASAQKIIAAYSKGPSLTPKSASHLARNIAMMIPGRMPKKLDTTVTESGVTGSPFFVNS